MSASRSVCDNKAVVYLLSVVAIVLWGMSYIWSDKLIALDVPIFYFVPIRILVAGLILQHPHEGVPFHRPQGLVKIRLSCSV